MNWSRGLLRLWIIVSAVWALFIGVTFGPTYVSQLKAFSHGSVLEKVGYGGTAPVPSNQRLLSDEDVGLTHGSGGFLEELRRAQDQDYAAANAAPTTFEVLANAAKVFALPPLILLVAGAALRWVAVGFRPSIR